ncbi:MAG TPA: vitamin B12-dependent ribonucleotide reductase [Anaerolineae bacterium]|nr:vitamin B12-dependent ribonucleotide reductase [Anaerolineae bacterium]
MSQGRVALELSSNAMTVLERRYLKRDESGRVAETSDELFWRVATHVAQVDALYDPAADVSLTAERFYSPMASLEFLPNSPTLMNAGRSLGQLSACFVLPIDDSMESIFESVKNAALIHQSGGGTGFSFSRLRPKGDMVRSTGGIASGPISFMEVFDAATEAIKQGGARRGANMAILRVDHPDIADFITAKSDGHRLNNFNTSVGLTKEFMEALKRDATYPLVNPRSGKVVKRLRARAVMHKIAEMAWKNGDPGVIFLDRLNEANPTPHLGEIESTNPCGEQPLLPFESCNLGSINLSKLAVDGQIHYERLGELVDCAVHFLDNIIDCNKYPLPQIEDMTLGNRKIGLGVMGFADMLIHLNVAYDSDEAEGTAEHVMAFIQERAKQASALLAEQRGAFPNFRGSIYEGNGGRKMRNATVTTVAPTGSISIIAGASSGIEPIYALVYTRHVLDGDQLLEVNPTFRETAEREGFYSPELMTKVALTGSVQGMPEVPPEIQRVFVTAHDIAPEWHIRIQAAFQRHTDNAVSKTINFPHNATRQDVENAYLMAYDAGCKGLTIYRDGSRAAQVLTKGSADTERPRGVRTPRARPTLTQGVTEKVTVGCGQSIYVTINEDQNGLFEVFATMGKSGGCMASQSEAIGRLISLALRSGIETDSIVKQLEGIRCPAPAWQEGNIILSCADAIGKAMHRYVNDNDTTKVVALRDDIPARNLLGMCPECPDCGTMVEFVEGCLRCPSCGYSQCG